MEFLSDAISNLTSPMILFFILGFISTILKSDIEIPEVITKTLAIYFMIAIGLKGGFEISKNGIDSNLYSSIINSLLIGIIVPVIAFLILKFARKFESKNSGIIILQYD